MSRAGRAGELIVPSAVPADDAGDARPGDSRPGYFDHSAGPLVSLVFVAPLILIYELGTRGGAPAPASNGAASQHVIAFSLLQEFFAMFGATGKGLPALAVAGILLAWHVARHDGWAVRWTTLVGMALEGSFLSLPLLALSVALAHLLRLLPLAASHGSHSVLGTAGLPTDDLLLLCLGAGIYEELVFRLIGLTILTLLVKDLLQVPRRPATLLVVLVSAVLFAGYHYLGSEVFRWRTFAFRTLAGIYFGILFLTRGFGVTAATHAAYDILVLLVLS